MSPLPFLQGLLPPICHRTLHGYFRDPCHNPHTFLTAAPKPSWLLLLEGCPMTPDITIYRFQREKGTSRKWASVSSSCRRLVSYSSTRGWLYTLLQMHFTVHQKVLTTQSHVRFVLNITTQSVGNAGHPEEAVAQHTGKGQV